MLGLELHRSWERLAALARALNGQRLLREGPKTGDAAVEMRCVLECWSLHHQGLRAHPQAIRLCDVVRATCAGAGWAG